MKRSEVLEKAAEYVEKWGWNDAPGRTKEEVISLMRTVAADLRTRGE